MTQIVKISDKENIDFFRQENQTFLAIKPACEILKIDHAWQIQNIRNDEILGPVVGLSPTTGKDGKIYEMVHLPLEHFIWWLLKIDANKVKPENRDELKLKQWLIFNKVYSSLSDRIKLYQAKDKAIEEQGLTVNTLESEKIKIDNKLRIEKRKLNELKNTPVDQFGQLSMFTDEEMGTLPGPKSIN